MLCKILNSFINYMIFFFTSCIIINTINFFNYILGSDGKTPLKPEIEMPKKCLDKFQLLAGQVVFVGDSENDILPAKRLGMFSVHVTYGYGKLQEKIKADLVISKIEKLRKIF